MTTNPRETRKLTLLPKLARMACLLTALGSLPAAPAAAQCAPHDLKEMRVAYHHPAAVARQAFTTIEQVPAWKTMSFDKAESLHHSLSALEQASCGIGNSLAGVFAMRGSPPSDAGKVGVTLARVSPAGLGLTGTTASLDEIYARAAELGLRLLQAEAAAQLRLQYLEQPVGEWLHVAMQPIDAALGSSFIFEIGNSGAGLKLIEAGANMQFYSNARFVFAIAEQARGAKEPTRSVAGGARAEE